VNPLLSRKNINRLAIPAIFAGIAEPILSISDTAIVGNIPVHGVESLAAAGIVGSFLTMLVWILTQTSHAISAIVLQYVGEGRLNEIKSLPAQAIFINVALSLLILVGTLPFSEAIFRFLNASGTILEFCISYYGIRAWGFPLTLLVFTIMGVFQGLQNTLWPMAIALTGVLLNIGLDLLLVYGLEGWIPAMHLEGAAWASLISQGVMALMALYLLVRKTPVGLEPALPLHPELKRLAGMALNLFVRALCLNIALLFAVREATALGDREIGAHTIAINLWLFAAFFIDGYAIAGKILGGLFLGARDYQSLWALAGKTMRYGLTVTAVLMVGGLLFYPSIGRAFSADPAVHETFNDVFILVIGVLPVGAVAFIYDGLFKGMGKMRMLRNTLLAATFLGFLPMLYLGKALGWGLYGIWGALAVWMAVRGGVLVWKFRQKFHALSQKV
jgi:putative MATE family efflux protein